MAKTNLHVVNLVMVWVATKLTEPLRFGATALILPKVVTRLGRGYKHRAVLLEEGEGLVCG
eukprot:10216047-Ditylum_brightwellii.AAC.2